MDKNVELKAFIGRYFDFWSYFNPGRAIPSGLGDTAKRYYQDLTDENVKFEDFDRICKTVEKDFGSLGYDFNIVSYVIDRIRVEKLDKIYANKNNPPAISELAPEDRLFSGNQKTDKAIKILEKNKIKSFSLIIEKLRNLREQGKFLAFDYKCFSCMDTGFVSLSVFIDLDTGKKKVKIYEQEDSGCIQVAKRCVCPVGESISSNIIKASRIECIEAAKVHGGKMVERKQYADMAPF